MRPVLFHAPVVLALAVFCMQAMAAPGSGHNRYKWRDDQGNLHYSDSLPTDAAARGYDLISADGIIIKHVDRAQTAAERDAARSELAKQRAAREQAANLARTDQQLIVAYPEEADLARAQQQQIDLLDQGIKSAQVDLENQEAELAGLLDRAAEFDRSDKTVPADLARQVSEMGARTRVMRDAISRKQAERAETARTFATDLVHYRELKAASAMR